MRFVTKFYQVNDGIFENTMYLKIKIYVCARVYKSSDRRQERDIFVVRKHRPKMALIHLLNFALKICFVREK